MNGGISVDGASTRKMDLETMNGGLSLTDVDGNVRGTTTNGGVDGLSVERSLARPPASTSRNDQRRRTP